MENFLHIGNVVINLDNVAYAEFENQTLGIRFCTAHGPEMIQIFEGPVAEKVWHYLSTRSGATFE